MLALLAGLLGKLCSWLADVLPESPFSSALGSIPESASVGVAWLNTFVPVSQIVALVTAWAAALVAVVVIRFVKKFTIDSIVSVFDVS